MGLRPASIVFPLLLLASGFVNRLHAQTTTTGGLMGVIADPSSAVLPDTRVEIEDVAKGITHSTKTDREGIYRFLFLAPNKYRLTASHDGFREAIRLINVPLGPPGTLNITLQIAATNTIVKVESDAPLIRAEDGDVSTIISQRQISEIPNPGNDLTYIAQIAPGAIMQTDNQGGAKFSILGMPGTSYLYTIDGMNDNDNNTNASQNGDFFLLLGQNQIAEATVVSTGYSGQFGGAAGGNINYITKSGNNEFHGNAQYYWNGRALNANDWFLNAFGSPRPEDSAHQWAASFGGPIKKEKLFFFLDTEGLWFADAPVTVVQIPSPQFQEATLANIDSRFGFASASDAFYRKIFNLFNSSADPASLKPGTPTDFLGCTGFTGPNGLGATVPCADYFLEDRNPPNSDALVSGRLDWNMAKNDRMFFRLQYDRGRLPGWTDPISPVFDASFNKPCWQGQIMETHTFSASAASQFLFAGSYVAGIFQAKHSAQALAAFPITLNFSTFGAFTKIGGSDYFNVYGVGRYNTQYQLSEDIAKTAGKHKLGFGGQFARIYWSELPNRSATIGKLIPLSLDAFYQGGVDPASPTTDFTQLSQAFTSETIFKLSFLSFAVYGQEEWHARSNLTFTAALRAEHYSNPVCRNHCFARLDGPFESVNHDPAQPYNQAILIYQKRALQNTNAILWSPRFSFAWQPRGASHNLVLRGGVGFFYDPMPGAIPDAFDGNAPLYNTYNITGDNLAPNETTNLFKDAAASNAAFLRGFTSGQTLAQIQAAISSFYPPGFSPPGMNAAAKIVHSPEFQRWSLELQQGFGAGTSVSLGYFGHHGIHELAQNPNANAFGFGSLPPGLCSSPPVLPCADPRFSGVTQFNTNAVSNYNGMVASIRHHFSAWGGGIFEANYTFGHAFDEVSNGGLFGFTSGSSIFPQDPNNLRGSYGPAEYDVRHSFNANYVWELPLKALLRGHGSEYLVKGWQVSGTIFARTGLPYTVIDAGKMGELSRNNFFGTIYAVPVAPLPPALPCGKGAAIPEAPEPCLPPQLLPDGVTPSPGALFVQSGCETGFNTGHLGRSGHCDGRLVSFAQGRNRFRGPGYLNTDFAIMKNTPIPHWEKAELGLGLQFFNFFNHPNFGFPDNLSSDPATSFGTISYLEQPPTGILGANFGGDISPRMIQVKAQLRF
jgi:Carboxypeptidase regulatory-like domain